MRNTQIIVMMVLLLSPLAVFGAQDQLPVARVNLLTQSPDPAKAGDIVTIRLQVKNTGEVEARDVLVRLVPEYPFLPVAGEPTEQTIISLPSWPEEDTTKVLEFRARIDKETLVGQYDVKFSYSINNGSSWTETSFTIDVSSRERASISFIDTTTLEPGKVTPIKFVITNVGKAPLQDMIFSWSEENGVILPVGSDNTRYIKYLDIGKQEELTYKVMASVNAQPDLYALDLDLQYLTTSSDGGTATETITTNAGVFVGGGTDFDVTFSESAQGAVSFSIANVGNNPSLSVTVHIPEQSGYRVSGTRDAIIGNLDKGDYTVVSFQVTPQTGMTGTSAVRQQQIPSGGGFSGENIRQQPLKVVVDYTDTTGQRNSVEKYVTFQLRTDTMTGTGATGTGTGIVRGPQQAATTNYWMYATIVIGVLLLVMIYLHWRRKP